MNYKDIPGYEGKYQVDTRGNVRNAKTLKVLAQFLTTSGYYVVNLYDENIKMKQIKVHQLVAMAFLNHKPNGMTITVDHINGIKSDNRLSNLQLLSAYDNHLKSIPKRDLPHGIYLTKYNRYRVKHRGKYEGCFKTLEEAIQKKEQLN